MPAVSSPARVLVTGASGFLGSSIVIALVERGYDVLGTVRSVEKGEWLVKKYGSIGSGSFEYVVVEDMNKPGAYDKAFAHGKPHDAVIHSASVVVLDGLDSDEVINPTVQGTVGILESARLHGPSVKRIVVTSSIAAIVCKTDTPRTFTEDDWNTDSVEIVEREGKNAPGREIYRAAKTLAEQKAWAYIRENTVNYDLVCLQPPMILGPLTQQISSFSSLNVSMLTFWNALLYPGAPHLNSPDPARPSNIVDVRDCALGHVLALEREEAGGERFIIGYGPVFWQQFRDELRDAGDTEVPEATPGSWKGVVPLESYDSAKIKRVLGMTFRPYLGTAQDALAAIRALPKK